MLPKTFYIETYGCQMNKLDGQLVADRLRTAGLVPAATADLADLVLFVTCSVRQHAEDRVYSNAGKLKLRKRRQSGLIIGILGCMAEKDRQEIFRRLPHVDFICGPGQLDRIEELIRCAAAQPPASAVRPAAHAAAVDPRRPGPLKPLSPEPEAVLAEPAVIDDHLEPFEAGRLAPVGEHPFHAYVRVMRGCDNFCSYCVVPYVRGPQASRPPAAILDEVRRLVAAGVRHVTLLGQSIGSYERTAAGRNWHLADLVRAAAETPGLLRLDFVTTHPKNLTDEILDCLAAGGPIAPYLHVPAQSGSNRILLAMNRGYTIEQYRQRVAAARLRRPALAVASDFIVGFPGETEADFEATIQLVREMDYSQIFAFKYSVRPGTAAAAVNDDVPQPVKEARLKRLLETFAETARAAKAAMIGQVLECLVTGPSRRPQLEPRDAGEVREPGEGSDAGEAEAPGTADGAGAASGEIIPPGLAAEVIQLAARSPGHQIVVFHGRRELIGRLLPLRIVRASALTLFGEPVNPQP